MSKTSIYTLEFSSIENPDITKSEKGKLINNKYYNFQIFRGEDLVVDMNMTPGASPEWNTNPREEYIKPMDILQILTDFMRQYKYDESKLPKELI